MRTNGIVPKAPAEHWGRKPPEGRGLISVPWPSEALRLVLRNMYHSGDNTECTGPDASHNSHGASDTNRQSSDPTTILTNHRSRDLIKEKKGGQTWVENDVSYPRHGPVTNTATPRTYDLSGHPIISPCRLHLLKHQ